MEVTRNFVNDVHGLRLLGVPAAIGARYARAVSTLGAVITSPHR